MDFSFVLQFLHEQSAFTLFLLLATLIPLVIGYLFGSKVLKLTPVLLFGALAGALTSGASLSIVTREAKSSAPALGYTGTYAFANIILSIAGTLMVLLVIK